MKESSHGGKLSADRTSDHNAYWNSAVWQAIDKEKLKKSTQEVLTVKKKEVQG